MSKINSTITVANILEMFDNHIGPINIEYNGEIIWDDDWDNCRAMYNKMLNEYGKKTVYFFNVNIVQFHHCELIMIGE